MASLLSARSYAGRAMRSSFNLSFSPTDAGKIVFVKAAWVNPRGQSGPVIDEIVKGIAAWRRNDESIKGSSIP